MPKPNGLDDQQLWDILHARAVYMNMQIDVREDPSDIVQETFVRAAADPAESKPIAWFFEIERNVFIDKLREHHAQKRDCDREVVRKQVDDATTGFDQNFVAHHTSPTGGAARNEESDLLEAAIARLPDREREVVILELKDHRTNAEIAEILGISKGTVVGLIARAKRRLAGELRKPLGEHD